MTSRNSSQDVQHIQDVQRRRHPSQPGRVDFTCMYAAHDACNRDLRLLSAAVQASRAAEPSVQAGWATFKHELHIHHTAEDRWLWPVLRDRISRRDESSVLDSMEAEHARIDPLLALVDAGLDATKTRSGASSDEAALTEAVGMLTALLTAHMGHEEDAALPLVEKYLGPSGWAEFGRKIGRSQGPRGAAELFPWLLDDAPADTARRLLGVLPVPIRVAYRVLWRPRYVRTTRWNTP